MASWILLTQYELGEKATEHFVVHDFCEMLVKTKKENPVFSAIKNALGPEEGRVTLWRKKFSGCIRKWNSNKRSHLMKGTHVLPRDSKKQNQVDSNIQDVAHRN